jgi:hypothetical protein
MPKFISTRDVTFFKGIARELVDEVIQNLVILYKVNLAETRINLYGEAMDKTWHTGVEIYSLINKDTVSSAYEGFGPDANQNIEFRFDKFACEEKNAYPEIGDVIYFDSSYYEISNTSEVQFVGGLAENNFSIVCSTVMVRKSQLNIEERIK